MVNKAIVGDAAVIPVAGLAYVYSYVNGVWVVVEPAARRIVYVVR
jgi:hypothetical protein